MALPTAIVTGGTRGIGAATASKMVARGYKVAVCGSTDGSVRQYNADNTARLERTRATVVDITDTAALTKWIDKVSSDNGGLNAYIHCAGRSFSGSVLDLEVDEWDRCMAINLRAPFVASKAVLPYLSRRGGAMVFITSIWTLTATIDRAAYTAAKSGLYGLVRALAVDHGEQGIRVNAVAPGYVDTALLQDSLSKSRPGKPIEAALDEIRAEHPLRHIATPEAVAESVVFLATEPGESITGQTLIVDNGITTRFTLASV